MLPTNVMSFMKKMVTTNDSSPGSEQPESGTALSKLRQTLSSSLMNAQDKVTKLGPARQVPAPDTASTPTEEQKPEETPVAKPAQKPDVTKPICRTGTCRVCLKSFKPNDFFRTCCECQQKVCEDCASYSKLDENQDESTWRCSICRRKMQSRNQPVLQQDSTDSLLDVPVLEALQRRHSDVKIGSGGINLTVGGTGNSLGAGLAPPRSPELRRHSDVSPASLKELEKVAGERREELRWERELEWRQHKRGSSPGGSRVSSPQVERRPFVDDRNWEANAPSGRRPSAIPVSPSDSGDPDEEWQRHRARTNRRKSRAVTRQHSYDEELKNGAVATSKAQPSGDLGLGLPVSLPRRASAYDVYATKEGGGNGLGLNAAAMAAVAAAAQRGGHSDCDGPSPAAIQAATGARRGSFRVIKPEDAQPAAGFEGSSSPLSPEGNVTSPGLGVDEDRRTRRRASALPDLGSRALPATPPSPTPRPPSLTRTMDEINDALRRQASVDGEAIKIVIHDVDSDINFNSRTGLRRRLMLRRDPLDKAPRSRGFGMRIVGGKSGIDGRLCAYIVWTVPGGVAEQNGLKQGDKVLEWDGVSLTGRSFEDVCNVMDRAGEVIEILIEHANDMRMCDLDDPGNRKPGDQLAMEADDKTPTSPTRRKLPKTPEQLAREKMVSGRVQLQVFYHDEKQELSVSVMAADDLSPREDTGYGSLPEAYVKLRLLPMTADQTSKKTEVAEPTQNPMWNATLDFSNCPGEQLMDKTIEVTLWDYCPDRESVFLGECTIDLQKAFLDTHPVWYRLEDPRQMRGAKTPHASPRGSLANEMAQRFIRRGSDFSIQRSFSDDKESEDGKASPEPSLLHPDHAWMLGSGSRRGSSQSEQLEVESYQLSRDFSRSLPGSRRSSFQAAQAAAENKDPELPVNYNKERRRSSCSRGAPRDPDEILRSLKAVKGELMGRAMSLTGAEKHLNRRCSEANLINEVVERSHKPAPQRTRSRDELLPPSRPRRVSMSIDRDKNKKDRKQSMYEFPERIIYFDDTPDNDERLSALDGGTVPEVKLGPGQIHPRGYRLTKSKHGDVKVSLLMTKGQLEVEVMCARNIACQARENLPDTYVKTYLRDGDRWVQKRKTRVVKHSYEPVYNQTLRYAACDVLGRSLLVMLWERQKGFEHNQGLGGAEVSLDKIQLTQLTVGWYPLFPIHSLGSDSNDSP